MSVGAFWPSQGANAVLAKPVRLESLKAAVEGHVGGGILA